MESTRVLQNYGFHCVPDVLRRRHQVEGINKEDAEKLRFWVEQRFQCMRENYTMSKERWADLGKLQPRSGGIH
jgi:hypothetical protein